MMYSHQIRYTWRIFHQKLLDDFFLELQEFSMVIPTHSSILPDDVCIQHHSLEHVE